MVSQYGDNCLYNELKLFLVNILFGFFYNSQKCFDSLYNSTSASFSNEIVQSRNKHSRLKETAV